MKKDGPDAKTLCVPQPVAYSTQTAERIWHGSSTFLEQHIRSAHLFDGPYGFFSREKSRDRHDQLPSGFLHVLVHQSRGLDTGGDGQ